MRLLEQLSIRQKGILLVSIPLFFELVVLAVLGLLLSQSELEATQETHSKAVIESTAAISRSLTDAVTTVALYWMSRDQKQRERYETLIAVVPEAVNKLRALCRHNPEQLKTISGIDKSSRHTIDLLNALKDSIEGGGSQLGAMSMSEIRAEARHCMKSLTNDLTAFEAEERKRGLINPERQQYFRYVIKLCVYAGVVFNIIVAVFVAVVFGGGIVRRLQRVTENSQRLSKHEPLMPLLGGRDELSQLDTAFHEMAAALTKAYQTLAVSEDRLRLIIESVPVALLIVNGEGRIESCNPGAERLWGASVVERNIKDVIGSDAASPLLAAPDALLTLAVPALEQPLKLRKNDGSTVFAELKSARFDSTEGQRLLLMVLDVTERHNIAEMRKQFVAMVSHDLRSPLTALQVLLQSLIQGTYGAQENKALERMRVGYKNVGTLVDLINDLLDLEKADAGLMELSLANVDLLATIQNSIDSVESLADGKNIAIEVDASPIISLVADQRRLERVLVNLLSNAIKFSPGGTTVKIVVNGLAKNGVEVHVVDQGPGIAPEKQELVFERYRQLGEGQSVGTGLGLANCKSIVEAHNGQIGVTSVPGAGCDFWFRLPLLALAAKNL